MFEDCGGALGRLHLFFGAVGGVDSAEATAEGAADAGVMDGGAFAEEGWPQVFHYRYFMEWSPGECVWAFHGALGVVARETEDVFVREAEDRVEGALAAYCVEELEDGCPRLDRERCSRHTSR